MPRAYQSILITGASSGIGMALARIYAAPGVHLALTGRDEKRLAEIVSQCRAAGASVSGAAIDVRARDRIGAWVHAIDDNNPIDLAIACAGIVAGLENGRGRENPESVRAILSINFLGVLNTLEPIIDRMCSRARGRIVFVGSLSGMRGMPYSPSYCATKAAIHVYAEALRGNLRHHGIGVSLVLPGFVATALNRDMISPKPLQMNADRAAHIIRRGLDREAEVIAFPRVLYYGMHLLRLLPLRLVDGILTRIHVAIPETESRMSAET